MSSEILDDLADVRGVIYCVEYIASGKKYVGQTRSHRLNHGRYRPFGAEGRFRAHISEAVCNTKHKSGHLLGIDIRQYGRDAFRLITLEVCDVDISDDREKHWIETLNTLYPNGYNLTRGGTSVVPPCWSADSAIPIIVNPTPLTVPRRRGGCTSRSTETRAKMKERAQALGIIAEFRAVRATNAIAQHAVAKQARFAGVKIDPSNLGQYIFTKGTTAIVRASERVTSFAGKGNTKEDNINRAIEFLSSLLQAETEDVIIHVNDSLPQTATLPNCSGNP
jgi:hypothetical protein